MYQFCLSKNRNSILGSSKILSPEIQFGEETAQFRGSLLTLFGQPAYKTSNSENAFQYFITATDDAGQSYEFTVYEGPSGLAIGGHRIDSHTILAAQSFVQYVKEASPADFEETMMYEDTGCTIVYGCKDGVCYYREIPKFTTIEHNNKELPDLTQNQLDEVLTIDFSNIKDEDDLWFWKNDMLDFSNVHFPTIRDLMRKDLIVTLGKTIGLEEVKVIGVEEGFCPEFSAETPEMALIALTEVWAWKTTAGKPTKKRHLNCSSFAWTLARAVYGFYGGNLDKTHAQANAFYEVYEDKISSQEDTLRFFYALLDLFKFKRL
ncbi:hypothetical protein FHS14_004767 [Paenibacillus baekrokdamisoli]|uniref:hypothetical protein n=1 Tax=Paenibacillus baekrokdamisoli TaxID=1712516 RepID=UPI000F7722CD|nr:hypothetical protein [Paenibacillus baekrokdamisoli]MBB3071752.1 hypothetical protein [Paenibacillus baekrokdamisoli]